MLLLTAEELYLVSCFHVSEWIISQIPCIPFQSLFLAFYDANPLQSLQLWLLHFLLYLGIALSSLVVSLPLNVIYAYVNSI